MPEIGIVRRASVCGGDRVVDVTVDRRSGAARKAAVLVAGAQQTLQVFAGPVPVDGEHRATDGVGEHSIPACRSARDVPRGRSIDGVVPLELSRAGIRDEGIESVGSAGSTGIT